MLTIAFSAAANSSFSSSCHCSARTSGGRIARRIAGRRLSRDRLISGIRFRCWAFMRLWDGGMSVMSNVDGSNGILLFEEIRHCPYPCSNLRALYHLPLGPSPATCAKRIVNYRVGW
jgi:hypothetical protein